MSGRDSSPGMISMSGSVVGGLKKWTPRKRPRRFAGRTEASSVTGSVLVLVARMACSGTLSASSLKMRFLRSMFSGAASMTSSHVARSSIFVVNRMRASSFSARAASNVGFNVACALAFCSAVNSTPVRDWNSSTAFCAFSAWNLTNSARSAWMVLRPRSSAASSMSRRTTFTLLRASTCAMRAPITPAPRTAACSTKSTMMRGSRTDSVNDY